MFKTPKPIGLISVN